MEVQYIASDLFVCNKYFHVINAFYSIYVFDTSWQQAYGFMLLHLYHITRSFHIYLRSHRCGFTEYLDFHQQLRITNILLE